MAYTFPSEHDEQCEVQEECGESQRHLEGAQNQRDDPGDEQQAQRLVDVLDNHVALPHGFS
jgi:hypothetical protein